MEQTYEQRLEAVRQWQREQDARPISKTINLLDTAEKQANRVAELVWSSNRIARDVKLRYVSEADAQDIREAIAKARHAVIELNEILGLAETSLNEVVEA